MALIEAIIGPISKLLDKIIPDPQARDRAKLELIKLQNDQEMATIAVQMQAIVAEAQSADPWTSRARPSFLYVMYTLILWALPMGLIAAADPKLAVGIGHGMTSYLRGLPEELYALFGTGYLGYTAARTWGKVKGVSALEADAGGGAQRVAAARAAVAGLAVVARLVGAELAVLVGGADIDPAQAAGYAGAVDLAAVGAPQAERLGVPAIQRPRRTRLAVEAAGDREQSRIADLEAEPGTLAASRIEARVEAPG